MQQNKKFTPPLNISTYKELFNLLMINYQFFKLKFRLTTLMELLLFFVFSMFNKFIEHPTNIIYEHPTKEKNIY